MKWDLSIASLITIIVAIVPFVILKRTWNNDLKKQRLPELEAIQMLVNKQNGLMEDFLKNWNLENKNDIPHALARIFFNNNTQLRFKDDFRNFSIKREDYHHQILAKIQIYFQKLSSTYVLLFRDYQEFKKIFTQPTIKDVDMDNTVNKLQNILPLTQHYNPIYISILKELEKLVGDAY